MPPTKRLLQVEGQPDIVWVTPNYVDPGGGASTRTIIIGAPGANFRHRIIGFSIWNFDVAAGGPAMQAWLDKSDAGAIDFALMATDKFPTPYAVIPSPGMSLDANKPIVVYTRGGGVGQYVVIHIGYYTDPA